jgi:putative membrane protein insertion efficiency factor
VVSYRLAKRSSTNSISEQKAITKGIYNYIIIETIIAMLYILFESIRRQNIKVLLVFNFTSYPFLGLIYFYKFCISPFLPQGVCRFEPSCSTYMLLAIKKYGLFYGILKGIWRICRCNPYCRGGYDPP